MKICTHCGRCCLSGVPCCFGQILFDITEQNPQACLACEYDGRYYWCGLIKNPTNYFRVWFGDCKWKCEAMSDIARIYIGIGQGCGINPSMQEIMVKMHELGERRKSCVSPTKVD